MALLSRSKRVLLIGGEGVALYTVIGRVVDREGAVSWADKDFEIHLAELLVKRGGGRAITIIFDGADQTYRKEENIPKLSFIDRPRFLRRKLELAFPSYPIRAALEIVPQKSRRFAPEKSSNTPPSYLFVALPETEQIDRVASAVYESGVPVGAFGLLPTESASLVVELSKKIFSKSERHSRWAVLIGQHETGGLRQVVVKDGNLALTRLTPTPENAMTGPAWVEETAREFKATLAYISRFGYTADDGLDVIVVSGEIEKQFFSPQTMGGTNFACMTNTEALSVLGANYAQRGNTNNADALHVVWIARKSKLNLPLAIPSIQKSKVPRMAAVAAIGLLTLSSLVLTGLIVNTALDYSTKSDELARNQNVKNMLDREYEQEAKKFDGLPVKPDMMKTVMSAKDMLDQNTVDTEPFLLKMKAVLGNDIFLERLTVNYENGPDFNLQGGRTASAGGEPAALPLKKVTDRGRLRVAFTFSLPDSFALEQKVQRAEELRDNLKKVFPGYTVSISSQFGKFDRQGKMNVEMGQQEKTAASSARGGEIKDLAEIKLEGPPL